MERLTERSLDYCTQHCPSEKMISCAFYKGETENVCFISDLYNKLREYEDIGWNPAELRYIHDNAPNLLDLVRAEREGRLVVLPCKVGDTVYVLDASVFHKGEIYKGYLSRFYFDKHGMEILGTGFYGRVEELLNKTVFLTREEAEKALEGVSEDA